MRTQAEVEAIDGALTAMIAEAHSKEIRLSEMPPMIHDAKVGAHILLERWDDEAEAARYTEQMETGLARIARAYCQGFDREPCWHCRAQEALLRALGVRFVVLTDLSEAPRG